MEKLNFGCGSIQPDGWINIDHDPEFNATADLESVEDDSVDIIVVHAALQQVPWHSLVDTLGILRNKLKPNGLLRISLPDIESGFVALQQGNIDWFPNGEENIDDRFSAWLTWYSTSYTLLTPNALQAKLIEAGFESYLIHETSFKETFFKDMQESTELDTREHEFYFMEARK